jgi:hypothetical protein
VLTVEPEYQVSSCSCCKREQQPRYTLATRARYVCHDTYVLSRTPIGNPNPEGSTAIHEAPKVLTVVRQADANSVRSTAEKTT